MLAITSIAAKLYTVAAFKTLTYAEMRTAAAEFAPFVDRATLETLAQEQFVREKRAVEAEAAEAAKVREQHRRAISARIFNAQQEKQFAESANALARRALEKTESRLTRAGAAVDRLDTEMQGSLQVERTAAEALARAKQASVLAPLVFVRTGPSPVQPSTPVYDPFGYQQAYSAPAAALVPARSETPVFDPSAASGAAASTTAAGLDAFALPPAAAAAAAASSDAPPEADSSSSSDDSDDEDIPINQLLRRPAATTTTTTTTTTTVVTTIAAAAAAAAAAAVGSDEEMEVKEEEDDVEDYEDKEDEVEVEVEVEEGELTLLELTRLAADQLKHVPSYLYDRPAQEWVLSSGDTWVSMMPKLQQLQTGDLVFIHNPDTAKVATDFVIAYGYPHKRISDSVVRRDLRLFTGARATNKNAGVRMPYTEGPGSVMKLLQYLDVAQPQAQAPAPLMALPAPAPAASDQLAQVAAAAVGAAVAAVAALTPAPAAAQGIPVLAHSLAPGLAKRALELDVAEAASREAATKLVKREPAEE